MNRRRGARGWLSGAALAISGLVVVGCGSTGGGAVDGGMDVGVAPPDGGEDGPESGNPAVDANPDAAAPSADGAADGAIPDGGVASPPAPYPRPDYQRLSETGLFSEIATGAVAGDAIAFEPTYKLWSDGATKRRWVRLPPGTKIDTSDMDHWIFPVGTKLWKEFSQNGVLLETRLVERYGTGPDDYWMGAFVWNAEQTDAVFAPDGQQDILGTMHDAPRQKDCGACHRGDAGRVLGLSAIQMSRSAGGVGPTLRDLATMRLLTDPPPDGGDYPVPGDPTTSSALGYLHANCGHCHNLSGTAWPDTQMVLRLKIADRDPATSGVVSSVVGKMLEYWRGGAITLRVAPGQPDQSAIIARMSVRHSMDQMPPLATEVVDDQGVQTVRTWIAALPPPN